MWIAKSWRYSVMLGCTILKKFKSHGSAKCLSNILKKLNKDLVSVDIYVSDVDIKRIVPTLVGFKKLKQLRFYAGKEYCGFEENYFWNNFPSDLEELKTDVCVLCPDFRNFVDRCQKLKILSITFLAAREDLFKAIHECKKMVSLDLKFQFYTIIVMDIKERLSLLPQTIKYLGLHEKSLKQRRLVDPEDLATKDDIIDLCKHASDQLKKLKKITIDDVDYKRYLEQLPKDVSAQDPVSANRVCTIS